MSQAMQTIQKMYFSMIVFALILMGALPPLHAQEAELAAAAGGLTGELLDEGAVLSAQEQKEMQEQLEKMMADMPQLHPIEGPTVGKIGSIAEIKIPEGMSFVEQKEMKALNQLTGNLHNPKDAGAILGPKDAGWLIFFSWDPVGYVSDDEKDELDADELMESFQEGNRQGNKRRRELNYPILNLLGWQKEPYYDSQTNNLTWALKNHAEGNETNGINHEVRLLGRKGVLSATLVGGEQEMVAAIPQFDDLLTTFSFNEGERYAEYEQGIDKVAAYGLTGLMLGGGLALAAKTGLLAKLGRFIKPILLGVVALFSGLGKFFKKLFGGGSANEE